MLQDHPDKSYVQFIIKRIQQGFRIEFNCCCSYPPTTNLPSQVPHIIHEHLSKEVSLNRMYCCPLGSEPKGTQISPIGAIPKKNRPGKWRLITVLSSPAGTSANDAVSKEVSSCKYTSMDHLSSLILSEGKEALLVKADIKEAYRMVPVHPDDQLLGVLWDGRVYIDKVFVLCTHYFLSSSRCTTVARNISQSYYTIRWLVAKSLSLGEQSSH